VRRNGDSFRCGLLQGDRDGDSGRSWSVRGRAAAKKGRQLLARLVLLRTVTIKHLGVTEAGERAFRRFLHNEQVSEAELIASAAEHLRVQVAGRRVIAIQDTSEINFSRQKRRKASLGRGGNGSDPGFFIHPVLVIDADSGVVLGLADIQLWEREVSAPERLMPLEPGEKESVRWLRGAEIAASLLEGGALAVRVISDREGDTYPTFARRPSGAELLVRAQTERALDGGGHLFTHLDALPLADRFAIGLPATPGRAARTAQMELRYGPVSLRRPRGAARDLPPSVELHALDVREIDAPSDAEPVHWRLLSSAPIESLAAAHQAIADYRRRWHIEQLFRTLKSQGLGLEESQLEDPEALRKLAIAALRAAVVCMQLVHARDGADERPATAAFSAEDVEVLHALAPTVDGRTKRLRNPFEPGSLAWAAWIVARLGGWLGAANGRPPGPITMHRGLQQLRAIAHGFRLKNVSGH
jgi:Transposase DDE domain